MCCPAPEVPRIKQAYSKHSDSITVEFTEVSGATSYILRAESNTGDFFSETVVSSSPGTVVQLRPYSDYRLRVMSVNSGGRSQPSYPIQARTGTGNKSPKFLNPHCISDIEVTHLKFRIFNMKSRNFINTDNLQRRIMTFSMLYTLRAVFSVSVGRVKPWCCCLSIIDCYPTLQSITVCHFTAYCHRVAYSLQQTQAGNCILLLHYTILII